MNDHTIAEHLGHYVYLLVDPADNLPFYVGKGSGTRYLAHGAEAALQPDDGETATESTSKVARIRAIRARGQEPRTAIVRHGLAAPAALEVEASVIDVLRGSLGRLTNEVSGHGADRGIACLADLETRYRAPVIDTTLPAILIRLGGWQHAPEPWPCTPVSRVASGRGS